MTKDGLSSCFSTTFMALHSEAMQAMILGNTLSRLLLASSTGDTVPRSLAGLFSCDSKYSMSPVVRKPVFGVSDQVRYKTGYTITEYG